MSRKVIIIITLPEEKGTNGVEVDVHHVGTNELDILETLPSLLKETANRCAEDIGIPLDDIHREMKIKFLE